MAAAERRPLPDGRHAGRQSGDGAAFLRETGWDDDGNLRYPADV